MADGLGQMAFAQSWGSQEQEIAALADELSAGQLVNLLALDRRVKSPVEVLQCFELAEGRQLLAFIDKPLRAHIQFVLEDQFQKLRVRQLMSLGFLEPQFQAGE